MRAIFCCILLGSFFASFSQNIVYVNPNAIGITDGTSWNNGYKDIQTAVQNATPNSEIWIKNTSGKDLQVSNTNIQTDNIIIDKPLALYGGFFGTEKTKEDRYLYNFSHLRLNGEIGNSASINDNSYNAFVIRSEVILDGFKFLNFNSNFQNLAHYGVVKADTNSKLTIQNCIFINNEGSNDGICISTYKGSDVNIKNVRFESNVLKSYGPIIRRNSDNHISISECDFLTNGKNSGYLFYSYTRDEEDYLTNKRIALSVTNSNFAGNNMGIYYSTFGSSQFKHNNFVINASASEYSFNQFGDSTSLYIEDCKFTGSYPSYFLYVNKIKKLVFKDCSLDNPASSISNFFYVIADSIIIDRSEFKNIKGSTAYHFNTKGGNVSIYNSKFNGGYVSSYLLYINCSKLDIRNTEFINIEAGIGNYFILDTLTTTNSSFTNLKCNYWWYLENVKNLIIDSTKFSGITQFETLFRVTSNTNASVKNSVIQNIQMANVNPGRPMLLQNWSKRASFVNNKISNITSSGPMIYNDGELEWIGNETETINSPMQFMNNFNKAIIHNSNFHGLSSSLVVNDSTYKSTKNIELSLINNIILTSNDTLVSYKTNKNLYSETISHNISNKVFTSGTDNIITNLDYLELYKPLNVNILVNKGLDLSSDYYVPDFDIAGNTRIAGDRIDIGAYEIDNTITTTYSLKDTEAKNNCFPNPFQNTINLKLNENALIEILSSEGILLKSLNLETGSQSVSTEFLLSGIYFIKITTQLQSDIVRMIKK
jgi:hypothetical protein